MRTLRIIYRKAVAENLIRIDPNPFKKIIIKTGTMDENMWVGFCGWVFNQCVRAGSVKRMGLTVVSRSVPPTRQLVSNGGIVDNKKDIELPVQYIIDFN